MSEERAVGVPRFTKDVMPSRELAGSAVAAKEPSGDLELIDMLLQRRPALDAVKTRLEKIQHLLTAAEAGDQFANELVCVDIELSARTAAYGSSTRREKIAKVVTFCNLGVALRDLVLKWNKKRTNSAALKAMLQIANDKKWSE